MVRFDLLEDRKFLKRRVDEGYSLRKLGLICRCSHETVRRYIKKHNIRRYRPIPDEEMLAFIMDGEEIQNHAKVEKPGFKSRVIHRPVHPDDSVEHGTGKGSKQCRSVRDEMVAIQEMDDRLTD